MVEVREDGNHPRDGNGARHPPYMCCSRPATAQCAEWLFHYGFPTSTRTKVVEVREDGNRPQDGNGFIDPTYMCCSGSATPQCVEWLLYYGFPTSIRTKVDYRYQEETRVPAHDTVETDGTEVVARTVLLGPNPLG